MAGLIIVLGCLLCCFSVIGILSFTYISISLGSVFSGMWFFTKWTCWLSLWGLIFFICLGAFGLMGNFLQTIAYQILLRKEQNRKNYKENALQSNYRYLFFIISANLGFIALSIWAAAYFQTWYLKYPFVIYLCWVFGYVASFPLNEEEIQQFMSNHYYYTQNILNHQLLFGKTVANSLVFLIMFGLYQFYGGNNNPISE